MHQLSLRCGICPQGITVKLFKIFWQKIRIFFELFDFGKWYTTPKSDFFKKKFFSPKFFPNELKLGFSSKLDMLYANLQKKLGDFIIFEENWKILKNRLFRKMAIKNRKVVKSWISLCFSDAAWAAEHAHEKIFRNIRDGNMGPTLP